MLVNDCSTDNGKNIIRTLIGKEKKIKLVNLNKRSGQAGCFNTAFRLLKTDFFLRMDADLQDDVNDLEKIMKKLIDGKDFVIGLRESRQHNLILIFITKVYDILIKFFFKFESNSMSSSMLGVHKNFISNLTLRNNDHRFLPLIFTKRGASISTVSVNHSRRIRGKSKYRISTKLFFGVFELIRFLYRLYKGVYWSCVE